MATNLKLFIVLAVIYATTNCSTCKKGVLGSCTESQYSFEINPRYYPDTDTINIGDTIWAEFNVSDPFTDKLSGQLIDYSNADNLGFYLAFEELVSVNPIILSGVVSKFKYKLIAGLDVPNRLPISDTVLKSYKVKDINKKYWFKLGIIPQNSGTFTFFMANPAGVTRNGNPCPKADFTMKLIQTNQHYYLYPPAGGATPGGADYWFYVR